MKRTIAKISGFAFAALMLISSVGCEKSRLNKETTTSEDNELAENLFNDVYEVLEETSKEENLDGKREGIEASYGNCAEITIDPALPDDTFPKTVTIDFGTTNCVGTDGRNRRGKIVATMTGYYRSEGTVITTTLDDYYVNDYRIQGTKTVTNNGRNSDGNLSYTVNVDGATITSPDGGDQVTWNSTRTRTWIEGESTTFFTDGLEGIFDDVYEITGTANGVNRNDRSYEVEITKALRIQLDCRWITSGTIELRPEDLKTRTVDFGDGTCDNQATVEIGNRDYTINMR